MGATVHQTEKIEEVLKYLSLGFNRIVLSGSAGVGKTYLLGELLPKLGLSKGQLISVTAPTHKAVAVLMDKIDSKKNNVVFSTIHSGLNLVKVYNKGVAKFVPNPKKGDPFPKTAYLIIDEASMIDSYLLSLLDNLEFPIIFVGDNKQINPVKENDSPIFKRNYPTVNLTEIIRQGNGNPIIDISRDLSLLNKGESILADTEDGGRRGMVYTNNLDKVISKLADAHGTNDLKYLAWENKEVDKINFLVRRKIYGEDSSLVELGEVIILNSPYYAKGEYYHNNDEIFVDNIKDVVGYFKLGSQEIELKYYLINGILKALHEDSIDSFRKACYDYKGACIKGEAKWHNYYQFMQTFIDFKYAYALTVHKSQGSTYKDAIVNVQNIKKNYNKVEVKRLLYTAVTRASELLIVYTPQT